MGGRSWPQSSKARIIRRTPIPRIARGASEWAREPYRPQPTGERWYPFFLLMFNPVCGGVHEREVFYRQY